MITKEAPLEAPQELVKTEEMEEESLQNNETLEIEFTSENELITINTANINILNSYLNTFINKEKAVSNMELTKLDIAKLYLLSFNCNETTCSYLLLDRKEPNRSFLVDDLIHIKEALPSPDQSKLLFIIANFDSTETFKVFEQNEWTLLNFELPPSEETITINEATWIDEQTIKLQYQEPTDNSIHEITLKQKKEELFN